jgi:hypothetical protein
MYEGLIGPADPYRYLHPPPALKTTDRPASVHMEVAVLSNGHSPAMSPATTEKPPQAQLLAAEDSFVVPPGTAKLVVSITAVDPPAVAPTGGVVDGNVYDFRVSAAGSELPARPGHRVTVVLRNPAGVANPTMERYASGTWARLETEALGALAGDSYAADTGAIGDLALVAAPGASTGGGTDPFVIVLAAGAVVLAVGTLVALRRQRRRPPPSSGPPRGRRAPPPRPRGRRSRLGSGR